MNFICLRTTLFAILLVLTECEKKCPAEPYDTKADYEDRFKVEFKATKNLKLVQEAKDIVKPCNDTAVFGLKDNPNACFAQLRKADQHDLGFEEPDCKAKAKDNMEFGCATANCGPEKVHRHLACFFKFQPELEFKSALLDLINTLKFTLNKTKNN